MVAWIALVVSVVALAWQVVVVLRDRPILGVITRADVVIGGSGPDYTWHVTVVNYGRRTQGIADIGLVGKDRAYEAWLSNLRNAGGLIRGPQFPTTIDPHAFCDWVVPHDVMTDRFPHPGQEFQAYVVRFGVVFKSKRLNDVTTRLRRRGRAVGYVRDYQRDYRKMP